MDLYNSKDLIQVFGKIYEEFKINKSFLSELDAIAGDGDLGITLKRGFGEACDKIKDMEDRSIGVILEIAGMTIAKTASSTIGTLVAYGLMSSAKAVKDIYNIDLETIHMILTSFIEGIIKAGKAKSGDKTILDALYPAVAVTGAALKTSQKHEQVFFSAYEAAKKGAEDTKMLIAKHGRAALYKEKTLGHIDPGAYACALAFKAIYEYIRVMNQEKVRSNS